VAIPSFRLAPWFILLNLDGLSEAPEIKKYGKAHAGKRFSGIIAQASKDRISTFSLTKIV